ncbi:hypothetical protein R3P38DRAFT_2782551 [Favolaschia claudopus]|uniref:Uncharacterized protein n=1 Tax=Favolaschia claudopus TaxID=2862362 RepID=A0AAW0B3B0_9AGAR
MATPVGPNGGLSDGADAKIAALKVGDLPKAEEGCPEPGKSQHGQTMAQGTIRLESKGAYVPRVPGGASSGGGTTAEVGWSAIASSIADCSKTFLKYFSAMSRMRSPSEESSKTLLKAAATHGGVRVANSHSDVLGSQTLRTKRTGVEERGVLSIHGRLNFISSAGRPVERALLLASRAANARRRPSRAVDAGTSNEVESTLGARKRLGIIQWRVKGVCDVMMRDAHQRGSRRARLGNGKQSIGDFTAGRHLDDSRVRCSRVGTRRGNPPQRDDVSGAPSARRRKLTRLARAGALRMWGRRKSGETMSRAFVDIVLLTEGKGGAAGTVSVEEEFRSFHFGGDEPFVKALEGGERLSKERVRPRRGFLRVHGNLAVEIQHERNIPRWEQTFWLASTEFREKASGSRYSSSRKARERLLSNGAQNGARGSEAANDEGIAAKRRPAGDRRGFMRVSTRNWSGAAALAAALVAALGVLEMSTAGGGPARLRTVFLGDDGGISTDDERQGEQLVEDGGS